jgi:hypothetical protein
MKRTYFIAIIIFLGFFLIYASPKESPFLDPGSGSCSQYNNAADCEANGCEAEYAEKKARNAFGCESTLSVFSSCKERTCTPLNSLLSATPTRNLIHSIPYAGSEDLPVPIEIRRTGTGYTFNRISGGRYTTEDLAKGEYCKVVGVNFLDGTESYTYPLVLVEQTQLDERTVRCLYGIDQMFIDLFDEKQIYVYDNGIRVSNCPTGAIKEGVSTCRTNWDGVCTIKAAGKVQMSVLIKEYCGGWDAKVLSREQNPQSETNACDQQIRNALNNRNEEKCGNNIIDNGEECDIGADKTPKTADDKFPTSRDTCQKINQKFTGGDLHCNQECKIDTSDCQCYAKVPLGYVIGEGGIKNRLPLVGGSRGRTWGKMDIYFVRYDKEKVGLEADMTTKVWAHVDAFSAKYDELIRYNPSKDKFNLREFFPPKDYGKSFIIELTTTIKDGKITLKSKYVQYGNSPPSDLAGFVITNPEKTMEKTVDLTEEEVFTYITEKMFTKLVGFFVSGNSGGVIFPGEYGKFSNTISSWPQQNDLTWLSEDHVKEDNSKYSEYLDKIVQPFKNIVQGIMLEKATSSSCD